MICIRQILELHIDNEKVLSFTCLRYQLLNSCDGRVVKALDLKSNGILPRRFELYSQRNIFSESCKDDECFCPTGVSAWKAS